MKLGFTGYEFLEKTSQTLQFSEEAQTLQYSEEVLPCNHIWTKGRTMIPVQVKEDHNCNMLYNVQFIYLLICLLASFFNFVYAFQAQHSMSVLAEISNKTVYEIMEPHKSVG